MKRAVTVLGGVIAVSILACTVIWGPRLFAGYQFMASLAAQDELYQADGGAWPQRQDTCVLCHGFRGQSSNARYAPLAGQSAAYIESQLHAFAEGRRHSPQMGPLAASLTAEQIKALADYFSRQSLAQVESVVVDESLEKRGRELAEARGCSACHGATLSGGMLAPRIAGMGEAYLSDQLVAFKHNRRNDPGQAMNAVAAALSEDEIRAVVHYIANLSPVAPVKSDQLTLR